MSGVVTLSCLQTQSGLLIGPNRGASAMTCCFARGYVCYRCLSFITSTGGSGVVAGGSCFLAELRAAAGAVATEPPATRGAGAATSAADGAGSQCAAGRQSEALVPALPQTPALPWALPWPRGRVSSLTAQTPTSSGRP